MPACVQYPTVGCIVEYFDASALQTAVVLEEVAGKLRVMLANRRETKLPSSRVLPWTSPPLPGAGSLSRDEMAKILEETKHRRDEKARALDVEEIWELSQGEVHEAQATWFAELVDSSPTVDDIAAVGRALLACRTRFRFVPPNFEVYDEETVNRREEELRKQKERDRVLVEGQPFFRMLADVAHKRGELWPEEKWPAPEICERLEKMARQVLARPDNPDPLWEPLVKGLGSEGFMPVLLLTAWGRIPPHYNFWYDRADYARGDRWWKKEEEAVRAVANLAAEADLPVCGTPFVSVDGDTTRDIDDAFHLERDDEGRFVLTLALACPALGWPFGEKLDQLVFARGTSIYLPEGDSHMLPECLGLDVFSLLANKPRPALLIRQVVEKDGKPVGECDISFARVTLAANLRYGDCQDVLDGKEGKDAQAFRDMLLLADEFRAARVAYRVSQGAVSLERKEARIELVGDPESEDVRVVVHEGRDAMPSQDMVAEMMILASAVMAEWALHRNLPVVYRTQDVDLPAEYAGVWHDLLKIGEIMRAMIPSSLEVLPLKHAALGLSCYAPVTSPLRRYADLLNEAQLLSFLKSGKPRFEKRELESMLLLLHANLEAASQIQRFRPRYWKLLFFRQQGEERWWPGLVTDENEQQATVTLPDYEMQVRGKRRLFDERTTRGTRVRVRLGRVNPLFNEIQLLEVVTDDEALQDELLGDEELARVFGTDADREQG